MFTKQIAPSEVPFLAGGGEMGRRISEWDWSGTPLGPLADWPQSLKVIVRVMLTSRYAMWMGWGPELIFFCNDAYRPTLGVKDAWALGTPAREVWAEIWRDVESRTETVLRTGKATWDEGLRLFLERSGYTEETYHTFSYSPVPADDGSVGGMLCVVAEDTERAIGERRLALLRELATDMGATNHESEVFAAVRRCLAARPHDLPFTLTYLFDAGGGYARLAGASGVPAGHPIAPARTELDAADAPWPARAILAAGTLVRVEELAPRFAELPQGPWDKPARQAILVPIARQGQERPAGFLVAALNPYRPLDAEYRGFVELFAGQIASGLSNARAYAEERRRAESLAELDRAKTVFFSNVSHEFRTPLTLLLAPVEDALADADHPLPAKQRERLDLAHRNALRLLKLVNTLLDFSRIEAGRVQAVYEPTDLAALTTELVSNFRSACQRAGLELLVDCPPLPEPIYVDPDMWEKIVLNLVSNAFKFTLEGRIEVALRPVENAVTLTVRDTGTGIAAEDVPRMFERFHRIEGARGRTQEGSGIGLALVRELARLHGGDVRVESTAGVGSTFTVTLPRGKAHLPAERIGTPSTLASTALGAAPFLEEALRWLPDAPGDPCDPPVETVNAERGGAHLLRPPTGSHPHILLADDNADMREYVRRLLTGDYRVIDVANGLDALAAARRQRPDLILSDVMMPGLDGFALLRELRADPSLREVPFLLLSARAGEEARVEGLKAGADDYLTKPFSAKELLARVGAHLELAALRRAAAARERQLCSEIEILMEAMPIGVARAHDPECRKITCNPAGYQMLRLTPGSNISQSVPLEERPNLPRTFRRGRELKAEELPLQTALATGKVVRDNEMDMVYADGSVRNLHVFATPLFDERGLVRGGLAIFVEVTPYRRLENELRAKAEQLVEADRRKDEFLATLAHELRNPLAPLRNALQVLKLAGDNPKSVGESRGMMERQLQQMVHLIDDLLDVSRISRDKLELRKQRVELADVMRMALETSRPLLEAAGHEWTVTIAAEAFPLDADPTRLAQVFSNLLNNAAKYTQRGGRIEWLAQRENGEAVVTVRDNGIGIPAEMLSCIFEMFAQVDRSLERTQGGLGIGLTLVKRLVEMHGGRVEAHSAGAGRGSEFVVRLPLAQMPSEAERPPLASAASNGVKERGRVLIVDDNRDAATSLALLLRYLGYTVELAFDGLEAIAKAEVFRPEAVLLDIGLPRLNGYAVARRLREQPWGRELVLIATTGWGQDEDRRRSREAGFDHHLVKPVDPSELQPLLRPRNSPSS